VVSIGPPVVPGAPVGPPGDHEAIVIASVVIRPTIFSFRLTTSPQLRVCDLDAEKEDAVPTNAAGDASALNLWSLSPPSGHS
jgi:hypothetical protein